MKVVDREIRDLIPAEYNPRHLTNEQAEHLEASLKRFGAVDPAIINIHPDRKNIIIGGHQRLKTAQRLGWDTFPCVELELDKEKERELNIRLNKNTGGWDYDALANYFEVEELIDWGFKDEELFGDVEAEELEAEEDNYEEPDEIHTDIVLGDLIEIGEHRLLCGDSTDSDQVAKLMNGEKADMIFTDPPYLGEMGSGGFSKDLKLQKSKDKKINEIRSIYNFDPTNTFPIIELIKKEVINVFLFCNKNLVPKYLNYALDTNRLFDILTWHKTSFIPANNNTYYPDTEYLIKIKDKGAFFKTGLGKSVNYGKYWVLNNKDKEAHPTVKPQEIIKDCFLICSKTHDIVVDLFLGSGSTMVASHQLKRKCYGMELDPKYCQVIIDRMLKLDETLEVKINGEPYGV